MPYIVGCPQDDVISELVWNTIPMWSRIVENHQNWFIWVIRFYPFEIFDCISKDNNVFELCEHMFFNRLHSNSTGFSSFIITKRWISCILVYQPINTIQEILFCYMDVHGKQLGWSDKRRVMTFWLWHRRKDIPCDDISQVIALLKSIFTFLWSIIITQCWFFHPLYRLFYGQLSRDYAYKCGKPWNVTWWH